MSRKRTYAERQAARLAAHDHEMGYDVPLTDTPFACMFTIIPDKARVGDQVAACVYRSGGKMRPLEDALLAFFHEKANAELVAKQLVEIDPTIRLSSIQEFNVPEGRAF